MFSFKKDSTQRFLLTFFMQKPWIFPDFLPERNDFPNLIKKSYFPQYVGPKTYNILLFYRKTVIFHIFPPKTNDFLPLFPRKPVDFV